MYNGTYNKAVYWNSEIENLVNTKLSNRYTLTCGYHARQRINENGLPQGVYKASLYGDVVECEFVDGCVHKVITRLPHKNKPYDICFAVMFNDDVAFVKTVWLNSSTDNHDTIRKENYKIS